MSNYFGWRFGDIIIAPHKSFEYQFEFGNGSNFDPFELSFKWTSKQDHAGLSFNFGIKNLFWIHIGTYDHRHWNYKQNRWALPGDVEEDE